MFQLLLSGNVRVLDDPAHPVVACDLRTMRRCLFCDNNNNMLPVFLPRFIVKCYLDRRRRQGQRETLNDLRFLIYGIASRRSCNRQSSGAAACVLRRQRRWRESILYEVYLYLVGYASDNNNYYSNRVFSVLYYTHTRTYVYYTMYTG